MKFGFKHTVYASFAGYVVQASVNNFAPLLFTTFSSSWNIPLSKITLLITINFCVQILTDIASVFFVDRIGYRAAAVAANAMSCAGFVGMAVLPGLTPDPYAGLLASVVLYAVGGGLLEVTISPIVEACPSDNKEMAMSMLHSFYCWGSVGVVLISTLFFSAFGIGSWKIASLFWGVLPALNAILFSLVPINDPTGEKNGGAPLKKVLRSPVFWVALLLMFCSGASELSISQWVSAFTETGLGVGKAAGDLAGTMMFAVMMGLSRLFYGKFGYKIRLMRFMALSVTLCAFSYAVITLCPVPAIQLAGCALCGLSVGIMWPGTYSTAVSRLKNSGTAVFALLALAGDIGCASGPTLVGLVSNAAGGKLSAGLGAAAVFPVMMAAGLILFSKLKTKDS